MSYVDLNEPDEEEDQGLEPGHEDEGLEAEPTDEERAYAQGWRPYPADVNNPQRGEYRGDPRKWTDAATFLQLTETEAPVMRRQLRDTTNRLVRTDRELETLRATVADQKAAIDAAVNLAKRADERGYQRALDELKARRAEAVASGDTEGFDVVQNEIDAMQEARLEHVEPAPPPPAAPPAEGLDPAITEFVRENPWFNDPTKKPMQNTMIALHNAIIAEHPDWSTADQLDLALERMEGIYPELIPNGEPRAVSPPPPPPPVRQRRAPASLPPSGPVTRGRTAASPIDTIQDPAERAEARSAYQSIKRGDPEFTEAEYMAIYENPHADALDLRRQRKPRK